MAHDKDRLAQLEQRLARIETVLEAELGVSLDEVITDLEFADAELVDDFSTSEDRSGVAEQSATSPPSSAPSPPPVVTRRPARTPETGRPEFIDRVFSKRDVNATTVMACGAALSFVLAAAYFLRLVYDAGWLTPPIQLSIAVLSALALIAAGLTLAQKDRQYAAWLPGVGVIILYLTTYAGHLYYELIPHVVAIVIVGAVSVGALVLGRRFENSAYSILAAVGVYLTPMLVDSLPQDLVGLLIYFTAWSLLFSFLSIQEGNRVTYLVAMYMAIICFDAAWRSAGEPQWVTAAIYQFLQFLVFAATAAYFSVRYRKPMESSEALAHGLPLLYFYLVEYFILREHARPLVSVIALGSVAALIGCYVLARRRIPDSTSEAAVGLVSTYASCVTGHILFFELVPTEFLPWATLVLPLGLVFALSQKSWPKNAVTPAVVVTVFVMICGLFLAIVSEAADIAVPFPSGTLFGYAIMIYIACFYLTSTGDNRQFLPALIYAGHLTFMVATIRAFDSGLVISISWAVLAVATLIYALKRGERIFGQSSLLVFSASAVKVLLYDLAGSPSIVRIITLIVVGASLYIGGWLYQNLVSDERVYHEDPVVNRHLKLIHALVQNGLDDAAIAARLKETGVKCLNRRGWTPAIISKVRTTYDLG